MDNNSEIDQAIYIFSKLPGLGTRSARRIILHLLQEKDVRLKGLITRLVSLENKIVKCRICGNMDNVDECGICSSEVRDSRVIAVVDTVAELWAMERSGMFQGKYHVLGHNSSATARSDPATLRLPELSRRCRDGKVDEVIVATNSTLEGQTTAYFITEYLKSHVATISRLASGIPIGGELDYLDDGTLSAAITSRQPFI